MCEAEEGLHGFESPGVQQRENPSSARRRRRKRVRLWERDPRCFYCRDYLSLEDSTLDHVIPRDKGGGNGIENLVLCCKTCNGDKGSMSQAEFIIQLMEERIH